MAMGWVIVLSVVVSSAVAFASILLRRAKAARAHSLGTLPPAPQTQSKGFPVGPAVRCPQCDASPLQCTRCNALRTDVRHGDTHCRSETTQGVWQRRSQKEFLNFTHGTSTEHLCSPQRRVRLGFLWRFRCSVADAATGYDLHVHQKCERCGWRGITGVRSRPLPTEQSDLGSSQFRVQFLEVSDASGQANQQEPRGDSGSD